MSKKKSGLGSETINTPPHIIVNAATITQLIITGKNPSRVTNFLRSGYRSGNRIAIGPVVTCFSMFTHFYCFFCPSSSFCGAVHSVCDRILVFHVQFFMERLRHDHVIVKLSAYEMQRTR